MTLQATIERPERMIGRVMDRLAVVAYPPRKEPSPLAAGATVAEWAAAGGISCNPAHVLAETGVTAMQLPDGYQADGLAWSALRQLCDMGLVERVGSDEPIRYRPMARRPPRSRNWLKW